MNPMFKNALAITLLLSVPVVFAAESSSVAPVSPSTSEVSPVDPSKSDSVPAPTEKPSTSLLDPATKNGFKGGAAAVVGKTLAEKALGFVTATPGTIWSGLKATPGAVVSMPTATEGAHLGGYLTTETALNLGAKFVALCLAYRGVKSLYNWYTTRPSAEEKAHAQMCSQANSLDAANKAAIQAKIAHKAMVEVANAACKGNQCKKAAADKAAADKAAADKAAAETPKTVVTQPATKITSGLKLNLNVAWKDLTTANKSILGHLATVNDYPTAVALYEAAQREAAPAA